MPGTGAFVINGKTLETYFPRGEHRRVIVEPLTIAEKADKMNVTVKVIGGGSLMLGYPSILRTMKRIGRR